MNRLPTLNKFRILSVLAVVGLATPLLAAPADSIASRIAGYRDLGAAFKSVNDSLRAPSPDTGKLKAAAQTIRASAAHQYKWFPRGTGPEAGVKTAAKAAIWTNSAEFKKAQDAFAAKAIAFEGVAASGDEAAIRSASRVLGATCKSCHDQFREEK
ncbi:MAG: cytochrome c [Novosphingobium sp.]|nr:cytochrome c [Novosphingobium sp.]